MKEETLPGGGPAVRVEVAAGAGGCAGRRSARSGGPGLSGRVCALPGGPGLSGPRLRPWYAGAFWALLFVLLVFAPAPARAAGAIPPGQPSAFYPAFLNLGEIETAAGSLVPDSPYVTADAAVLMDAATGQVLWAKNARRPRPPASTTKIMTALLALEGGRLEQVVTVSPHAAAVGESSMHLSAGEKLTLEQLLYGALLRSGNDACVAIAEHIAGSEGNFVHLMNLKARELGAENTHFVNPNGLPAAGHLSSAYDLALLTRCALQNPVFNRIVATRVKNLGGRYYFNNTNRLLWSYQGADGVKTGTTSAAGMCLVASATRDGRRLISVVLHSDDRYADTMNLLDYGFARFKNVTACRTGQVLARAAAIDGRPAAVPLAADRELTVTVPVDRPQSCTLQVDAPASLTAPVAAGVPVGRVTVLVDGRPAAGARLITGGAADRLPAYRLWWKRLNLSAARAGCCDNRTPPVCGGAG